MMPSEVVLTMDTLELVPFEGTQLQRVEDFDASKFHIKELRIKDLHKNLCKKPYFHFRLESHKRNSAAERAEANGQQHRSSLLPSEADYETCADDAVASVPEDPVRVPAPSEVHSEEFRAPEQQPSHRTSKREKRLPGKFRQDGNSLYDDFPDRYLRYYRRAVSKSKAKKHYPLPEKSTEVEPRPIETQFFEVPIEAHEVDVLQSDAAATTSGGDLIGLCSSTVVDSYLCTPSGRRKAPARPMKKIRHSPSSSQKQVPTTKHCRVSVDHSECMEVCTDTDPHEGRSKNPKISSMKWRHHSPDKNTKEFVSAGKMRTVDSKSTDKTSRNVGRTLKEKINRTMGTKGKETKGYMRLASESELERTFITNGSIEEILPMRWRLTSPIADMGEIVTAEKKTALQGKLKEKKNRTAESEVKEKNSRILESSLNQSYIVPEVGTEAILSRKWKYNAPDASTGKRTLESKSKEKKARTTESRWNEKKGGTFETESTRRHSGPELSAEDILPMKWRLPKETGPLDSLWNEKNRRTSGSKVKEKTARTVERRSKPSSHAPDISTQKIRPLKRKHSSLSASLAEEILFPEKRKAHQSKLTGKKSKTIDGSSDASTEETLPAERQRTSGSKYKKSKTTEVSSHASIEKNLPVGYEKTPDRKLETKKSKTAESKSKVKKGKDGKPAPYARVPIRRLKGGYTDGDGSSDMERDALGPGNSYPTFATEMKHSNVITCFWMGIPADFSSRHMPDHDEYVVLQDAKGLKWEANYLARKKGLSGGWRRFALDHHLEMGDIVVFELVKPLKFLVHITKGAAGENPNVTVHSPVRETSKKVLKHRASSTTKRVSTRTSALFPTRKRVNKVAEDKLPSKKPRSGGGDKLQREGEKRASDWMTPVAKPNRLYNSGGSKKERQVASKDTEHYESHSAHLSSEESEDEEHHEPQRGTRLPKFKRATSAKDEIKDSKIRKDSLDLGLTVYEKSSLVSSPEPQDVGPLAPKPGPPKKKLRRVSYFYPTDEDQGHSIST